MLQINISHPINLKIITIWLKPAVSQLKSAIPYIKITLKQHMFKLYY
jgi:hypothetical protein